MPDDPQRLRVTTPDARVLDVLVAGPAGGDVVLVHHGTPGSCLPLALQVRAAAARGLRLVASARPGYAGSDRLPGRDVAAAAVDARAVLDAVGADTCLVAGWSGGGPHALACAVLLADRVRAAATIAGVAPHEAEGLDWHAGMGEENLQEFAAAEAGADVLPDWLATEAAGFAQVTATEISASLGDLVDDVDRAALTGEVAEGLAAGIREGLAPGLEGWLDDDLAFVRPWGFDLAAVAVPVSVWQGGHDRMVPQSHGRWLAAHVPGATARFDDHHGHISLLAYGFGDVLAGLLAAG